MFDVLSAPVLNGPMSTNLLNIMISLLKYGLNDCYGGFGDNYNDKDGSATSVCSIGSTTNWGSLKYDPVSRSLSTPEAVVNDLATLLTSGRLTRQNRDIIVNAFTSTLQQKPFKDAVVSIYLMVALCLCVQFLCLIICPIMFQLLL
jgi:hypothetical protein